MSSDGSDDEGYVIVDGYVVVDSQSSQSPTTTPSTQATEVADRAPWTLETLAGSVVTWATEKKVDVQNWAKAERSVTFGTSEEGQAITEIERGLTAELNHLRTMCTPDSISDRSYGSEIDTRLKLSHHLGALEDCASDAEVSAKNLSMSHQIFGDTFVQSVEFDEQNDARLTELETKGKCPLSTILVLAAEMHLCFRKADSYSGREKDDRNCEEMAG